ncbi:unnamed protein product [Vitrella brassicaformis CCMP3155]|uniref:Alpha 1,4-glycosyltransferase domain-containing protein n=1 Tax=Vitrella brassicaformis (strain CCMP3155) TaxID=1169540 RepID=A0A0G4EKV9_VITBC|nr:unnamed protein product [Vitrella brassicaformis CCMP3155]|eukprot:CEL97145.1 unnamed protein product [Vitrella brassicaformis CCMP3155]
MPVLSLFVIFLVLALLATSLFFAVQSPECVTLTLGDSHGFAVSCDGTQPSIPRQVFLTTKDKATMRTWERKNIKKCKSVNPGWAFNLYNDTEINDYVQERFPEMMDVWGFFRNSVEKTDFWRYLIVYDYGGLYMDTDIDCRRPIDELIVNKSIRGLVGLENVQEGDDVVQFAQYSFAFAPRHVVPLWTLKEIRNKVQAIKVSGSSDVYALNLTGPIIWTSAILQYMSVFGMAAGHQSIWRDERAVNCDA